MASSPGFTLSLARESDLPQLISIFPRSFHPTSPYMKAAIPETPIIADWWRHVHCTAINASSVQLLQVKANLPAGQGEEESEVIAICRWRLPGSLEIEETRAGYWSLIPLSPDHNDELYNAFTKPLGDYRLKLMGDRPHYSTFHSPPLQRHVLL